VTRHARARLHDCPTSQRLIRTHEGLLELLDELVDGKSAASWDAFYADRSKQIPFFGDTPDENLVEWADNGLLGAGRAPELGRGNGLTGARARDPLRDAPSNWSAGRAAPARRGKSHRGADWATWLAPRA
jgi:hypothetical protein